MKPLIQLSRKQLTPLNVFFRPASLLVEPPGVNGWEEGLDALDTTIGTWTTVNHGNGLISDRIVYGFDAVTPINGAKLHIGQAGLGFNKFAHIHLDVWVGGAWVEACVITDGVPNLITDYGWLLFEFTQTYKTDRIGIRCGLYEIPNTGNLNDLFVRITALQ